MENHLPSHRKTSGGTGQRRQRKGQRGNAMLEMALGITVLSFLLIGSIDFGPMMYTAIELEAAARAGAMYGVYNASSGVDLTGMQNTALANAPNISGVTATASSYYQCVGSSTQTTANASCPGSSLANYVSVSTSATYNTILRYGTVANPINLTRTAIMRIN